MKTSIKISVSPKDLTIMKSALENYNTKLDNMENRDLGYAVDKRVCRERRVVAQMQKEMGVVEE